MFMAVTRGRETEEPDDGDPSSGAAHSTSREAQRGEGAEGADEGAGFVVVYPLGNQ